MDSWSALNRPYEHFRQQGTQRGASLVEFSIVALGVILVGLFTLQLGLIYHAKTTLNYAVFEAARAGAVNNASMSVIREELGYRLAPLQGGDGSRKRALVAVTRSVLSMKDPVGTRVVILNPTKAAFKDWSVKDPDTGKRFIPVNHLRHQTYAIGRHSGLSLRDANLLKLQVTHGVDLRVPVVGKLMAGPMTWIDARNAAYYLRGKWPIQAVATVRMQSDSFESEILKSAGNGSGGGGRGETNDKTETNTTNVSSNDDAVDIAQGNADSRNEQNGHLAESGDNNEADDRLANETDSPGGNNDNLPTNEDSQVSDNGTEIDKDDMPADEVAGQTPPIVMIDCGDHVLPGIAAASLDRSADAHLELISTSGFREFLAQRDIPASRYRNLD